MEDNIIKFPDLKDKIAKEVDEEWEYYDNYLKSLTNEEMEELFRMVEEEGLT